jgi:hypothetical protein
LGGLTLRLPQIADKVEIYTSLSSAHRPHATAKEALAELVKLLDKYAPVWYTEEHRDRALSALRRSD